MSNRSSHFVHRLQTLPSALAGVPGSRRLLALAVVLAALLTLTLLPTTGQAQTPTGEDRTYGTEDDPRVPRNLSAQVEADGVALRWLPPAEDAASVDGYEILRGRPNEPTLTTLVSDTGNADTTYFDAKAIEGGVRYTYRVMAIRNGVRSDRSNIAIVLRPPSAPPPPLVSNIGQSASATANINRQYAQGFRLGKHGRGYEISSVSIDLAAVPSSLTVSLWIGAPSGSSYYGVASSKLFDFENPPSFKAGLNKFTAPAGAFAYPSVSHFIVLSGFGSSVRIKETTSDTEDAGGEAGAILFDKAHQRDLNATGHWSSPNERDSVLRLALEGSKGDSSILASNYGQTRSGQEIVSIGDEFGVPITVGTADRYLIRGFSWLADDTTSSREKKNALTQPIALHGGWSDNQESGVDTPGDKLFSLTPTTYGAGINEWTASQGATVAGGSSYIIYKKVTTRPSGTTLARVYTTTSNDDDTPTAPGVTLSDGVGDFAGRPLMAFLGEPLHAMVQNLGQDDNSYVSLGGTNSKVLVQSFTTGFTSYWLKGIGINIEGSDSNGIPQVPDGPSAVSVAVHIEEGGITGPKLFDLVSPGEFIPGHSFFEAPPGTLLLPNTTYTMVWSYLGGSWHRLQRTSSNDEDSGAQPGFRIANTLFVGDFIRTSGPHSSGDALEIAVYGEPVSDTTMVSNLGQSDNGYVSLGGTDRKVLTQSFRTGSGSYRLLGIDINIEGSDDSDGDAQVPDGPSSVSVAVHGGSTPFDLASPADFTPGHSFFEAPPGTLLEPNTSYVMVWSHLAGTKHRLQKTLSNNQDSGALSGFTISNQFSVGPLLASLTEDEDGNALEITIHGAASEPRFLEGSYQVGIDWFHLPDDVVVGDQFRLVFITQDQTDATSGDIEYYNRLVQEEAAQEYNHRIIRGAAPDFKAVVCTADVDARTYIEITEALGAPIYWLDGGWDDRPRLIANSHYEFFDPEWIYHGDEEDTFNTEWGAIAPGNSTYLYKNRFVWTGCDSVGVKHPEAHMGTTSDIGMVAVGTPGDPKRQFAPLGSNRGLSGYMADEIDKLHQLYAISPVFTVVAFPGSASTE